MGTGYLATLFGCRAWLGVLLLMLPGYGLCQENRPKFEIVAFVLDPSGAAVQGATVEVQSLSAGMNFHGPTNEAGVFCIQLEAGKYTVSVTRSGFKPLTHQIEVTSVEHQQFSFGLDVALDLPNSPCCFDPNPAFETEMSKLSDQLVLPPPVMLQLKPPVLYRNSIARFFSAIGHRLGF